MKTNNLSELSALMKSSIGHNSIKNVANPTPKEIQNSARTEPKSPKIKDAQRKSPSNQNNQEQSKFAPDNGFALHRRVNVFCWNVKATIAKAEKRNELLPILKRAQENEGTNAKDIASHLLGEATGRESVGARLLAICESLRLLEMQQEKHFRRFSLTEEGIEALKSGQIMVPQEGTWTIWASNDPLLSYPILRIDPFIENSAFEEVRHDKTNKVRERKECFEKIPKWVRNAFAITAQPAAIGNELIRIDHIEGEIEKIESKTNLSIKWTPEMGQLALIGSIEQNSVDATPTAPTREFKKIWQELLENENLSQDWDESKKRLLVPFGQTDSSERSSMQRGLVFKEPKLKEFGKFTSTTKLVRIFPNSREDAEGWAAWNLENKINSYAIESKFNQWREDALKPFEEHGNEIVLPTRIELANNVWNNRHVQRHTSTTWHLVAVEDWKI